MSVVIRDAGDAALLLELEAIVDPRVNAQAVAIAESVISAGLPGVVDVVPTFRSVAVYLDPVVADREVIRAELVRATGASPAQREGRTVDVPVVYGGDAGPDLAGVAAFGGLSEAEVIAMHAHGAYRVFMLGFLPGFAYLGIVDHRIAAPRQDAPRARVPAGSVGIAGRQTGIYPRESPGGWQIIGRTPIDVFDLSRSPPALFAPGDTVRFVPTEGNVVSGFSRTEVVSGFSRTEVVSGFSRTGGVRLKADTTLKTDTTLKADTTSRAITVVSPGLFTTVQDRGRWGHQASGVPVAGPMDIVSHDAANAALGNDAYAATLEVTLAGPELRLEHDAWVVVTGADLGATLDGSSLAPGQPRAARAGSVLRFGERRRGARAYLAVDGGIATPVVLGSRATHVTGGLGRALKAGDRLPLGAPGHGSPRPVPQAELPAGGARLRLRRGPQQDRASDLTFEVLQRSRFEVGSQSNRMAYRLTGPRLPLLPAAEMISDATFTGGIQVPPSGEPILLMADRQTTGGYPQVATLIAADIPVAGQLAPGDWVEFALRDDDARR